MANECNVLADNSLVASWLWVQMGKKVHPWVLFLAFENMEAIVAILCTMPHPSILDIQKRI